MPWLKRFTTNYMTFLLISDQVLTLAALALAASARLGVAVTSAAGTGQAGLPLLVYFLVAGLWLFLLVLFSAYDAHRTLRAVSEIQIILMSTTFGALALAGFLYLLNYQVPRSLYLYFVLIDAAFLIGYRIILRLIYRAQDGKAKDLTRILVIGAGNVGTRLAEEIRELEWAGMRLVGFLDDDPAKAGQQICGAPVLGGCIDAVRVAEREAVDEVMIALPPRAHNQLVNVVSELQQLPLRVKVVPDYFDLAFARTTQESLGDIPLIGLRDSAIAGLPRLIKRTFDLLAATLGTILLSPILLGMALAIKLDSPGPAIYKQQRVGENGRLFWMYKFRSMVQDAEARQGEVVRTLPDGRVIHKHQDDPRVTRVGRWLRKTSLDELPQLINVIKGEMSLVGPRPEMPWLVEQYEPWQRKRFAVPQGMTGWWQVNGRSDRLMHLNTQDDLYYIQNYSLLLDLQILWKTLGVVFKGRGAF